MERHHYYAAGSLPVAAEQGKPIKYGSDRKGLVPKPSGDRKQYALELTLQKLGLSDQDRSSEISLPSEELLTNEACRLEIERLVSQGECKYPWVIDSLQQNLPFYRVAPEIIETLQDDEQQILIASGETASGKTRSLPAIALLSGAEVVFEIEPRIDMSNGAADIAEYDMMQSCDETGRPYPKHFVGVANSKRSTLHKRSVVQVSTAAVLKKRMKSIAEEYKDKKVTIIVDEAHEGNLQTHLSMGLSMKAVSQNPNWKVVISSATIDHEYLQDRYQYLQSVPIKHIHAEGRPHSVEREEDHEVDPAEGFFKYCMDEPKTVIFADGKGRMKEIAKEITRRYPQNGKKLVIKKLHSEMSSQRRQGVFDPQPVPEDEQQVIICTTAGKSGVTFTGATRGLTYGYAKSPELNEEGVEGLPLYEQSKDEIDQSMGRIGRDVDGGLFVIVAPPRKRKNGKLQNSDLPFVSYDDREPYETPEIYQTNLASSVLDIAAIGENFFEINEYIPKPVRAESIIDAYEVLYSLGAVDEDNNITEIGQRMNEFIMRPELSRALVYAEDNYDIERRLQVAAIAAGVNVNGLVNVDWGGADWEQYLRLSTDDDFIAQLDLFVQTRHLYDGHGVDGETLLNMGLAPGRVYDAHKKFDDICKSWGIDIDTVVFPQHDEPKNGIAILRNVVPNDNEVALELPDTESEEEILDVFLVGMPNLLYTQKTGHLSRKERRNGESKVVYTNVLNGDDAIKYEIGDNSLIGKRPHVDDQTNVLAGYPRWKETSKGRQNFLEQSFRTDRVRIDRALGSIATVMMAEASINNKGQLVKGGERRLGSLRLGSHKTEVVKATSQSEIMRLAEYSMENPGKALEYVLRLAGALEQLSSRVPAERRSYYFEMPPMNRSDVEHMVYQAASGVSTPAEVDRRLWRVVNSHGLEIDNYISEDKRNYILEHAPQYVVNGEDSFSIQYMGDQAVPVIKEVTDEEALRLPEVMTIPDGREILFQASTGRGKTWLTSGQMRDRIMKQAGPVV